jgi:transketolase
MKRLRKSINRTSPREEQITSLKKKANWVRRQILEMAVAAGAGHIAPAFSCVDILVALYYGGFLRIDPNNPKSIERDRFILSKGHAAVALYAILADRGFFPVSELMTFTQEGSRLGGHTEVIVPGVEVATGSLGHGLSIGAGLALAAKMDQKKYRTVCLMSDGECHEGSVWEAAMFAGHHCLNNLIAIIDHNGLSAIDFLNKYLDIAPLEKKWESFGWDVVIIDGHSFTELLSVLHNLHLRSSSRPLAIIALTTKGKGVSFMENEPIWQYRIPQVKELKLARKELAAFKDRL